jgi:hypothetical protein
LTHKKVQKAEEIGTGMDSYFFQKKAAAKATAAAAFEPKICLII